MQRYGVALKSRFKKACNAKLQPRKQTRELKPAKGCPQGAMEAITQGPRQPPAAPTPARCVLEEARRNAKKPLLLPSSLSNEDGHVSRDWSKLIPLQSNWIVGWGGSNGGLMMNIMENKDPAWQEELKRFRASWDRSRLCPSPKAPPLREAPPASLGSLPPVAKSSKHALQIEEPSRESITRNSMRPVCRSARQRTSSFPRKGTRGHGIGGAKWNHVIRYSL